MDQREEIERLVLRGEKDPRTHTFARLADLYRKTGELDRALEVIEAGLKHHPHYLNARLVHARVLRELGRSDEAIAAFVRVLRIDSENLVARAALEELGAPAALAAPEENRASGPSRSGWLARLDEDWREAREDAGTEPPATAADPQGAENAEEVGATEGAAGSGAEPPADDVAGPAGADRPSPAEPQAVSGRADAEKAPGTAPPETAGEPAASKEEGPSSATQAGSPEQADASKSKVVELETATLAALYVRQGLFDAAVAIYERLLARDPYNARLATALEDARREAGSVSGSSEASTAVPPATSAGAPASQDAPAPQATEAEAAEAPQAGDAEATEAGDGEGGEAGDAGTPETEETRVSGTASAPAPSRPPARGPRVMARGRVADPRGPQPQRVPPRPVGAPRGSRTNGATASIRDFLERLLDGEAPDAREEERRVDWPDWLRDLDRETD